LTKTILLLLLFSSLYSEAKIYVGANYGYYDEAFSDIDAKNSTNVASVKIGYGIREAYAIELSVDKIYDKASIFSPNDADRYSINLEFVKAFDLGIHVNPFFKAGFGGGVLKVERTMQETLNYGSFNVGVGAFIPISDHIDLEFGYNLKYLAYESVDYVTEQTSYKSSADTIYSGFNVRF